jgi:nicotinate dehydrogenase subunit B
MSDHPKSSPALVLSRRTFLSTTGALVVGLVADGALGNAAAQAPAAAKASPASPNNPALSATRLDSYLAIKPDGKVEVYYGAIDGGQGLETSISQMVAEELDLDVDSVSLVLGDSRRTLNMGGASGATGVSRRGTTLAAMAAEARRLLLQAASARLSAPVDQLEVAGGVISVIGERSRKVSYADLIGDKTLAADVTWNGEWGIGHAAKGAAKPKPHTQYKVVGKSFRRRDLPKKVFAQLDFVNDVRLPGMLHARMIRPQVAGAAPVAVDETSIAHIPGAQVVRVKDLLAVVAPKEWNAVRAAKALKVTWSESRPNFPGHDKVFDHIRKAPVVVRKIDRENGSVEKGLAEAARVIAGEYEYPTHSHASMGPACAVADARDGGCTVWTSTQKPHYAADGIAELLALPREKVHAIWMFGTGSYGRNEQGDAAADAAVLSQALGRPVRVQYSREEGIAWDPKGTAAVNRLRAGIDANGRVIAYELISKAFSRENTATNEGRAAATLAGQLLGFPLDAKNTFNIPFASYTFDNNRVGWETIAPLMDRASPLRTTHLRDPYGPPILFGSESFMDEIAAALGMDPVEFRLAYLEHPRDIAAVRHAAEKAGWEKRPSPRKDQAGAEIATGRGIAYRRHFDTFIALVAEVRVHRKTGLVEPVRYVCAHECGLIVNPETLEHVIERQLVYGTSRTFQEEVQYDDKRVTSVDWRTYPVQMIDSPLPEIKVELINRPEAAPSGAAEMALGLVPAAVGNAVFDATGVRLRRVPFTPPRVKAALERT